ncbi:hypothetical protein ACEQ8H_008681 [Pleosporales sp. CAS-2024a]
MDKRQDDAAAPTVLPTSTLSTPAVDIPPTPSTNPAPANTDLDGGDAGAGATTTTNNTDTQSDTFAIATTSTSGTPSLPSNSAVITHASSITTSKAHKGTNLSTGAVAGVAIGALILGALVALAAAFFLFKRGGAAAAKKTHKDAVGSYNNYSESSPSLAMLQKGGPVATRSYVHVSQTALALAVPSPYPPPAPLAAVAKSSSELDMLPAVASDAEIRNRVLSLFKDMQRHVETFYRNVHATMTPSMHAALEQFGAEGVDMVSLLRDCSHPTLVIRHGLAAWIIQNTDPREDQSLFPGELVALRGKRSDAKLEAAQSLHRRLSVFLYTSSLARTHTQVHVRSQAPRELAEHFSLTFFPWANPASDDQEKEDDLTRIIGEALDTMIWLYGQPGEYVFRWAGVGTRGVALRPEMIVAGKDGGRDRVFLESEEVECESNTGYGEQKCNRTDGEAWPEFTLQRDPGYWVSWPVARGASKRERRQEASSRPRKDGDGADHGDLLLSIYSLRPDAQRQRSNSFPIVQALGCSTPEAQLILAEGRAAVRKRRARGRRNRSFDDEDHVTTFHPKHHMKYLVAGAPQSPPLSLSESRSAHARIPSNATDRSTSTVVLALPCHAQPPTRTSPTSPLGNYSAHLAQFIKAQLKSIPTYQSEHHLDTNPSPQSCPDFSFPMQSPLPCPKKDVRRAIDAPQSICIPAVRPPMRSAFSAWSSTDDDEGDEEAPSLPDADPYTMHVLSEPSTCTPSPSLLGYYDAHANGSFLFSSTPIEALDGPDTAKAGTFAVQAATTASAPESESHHENDYPSSPLSQPQLTCSSAPSYTWSSASASSSYFDCKRPLAIAPAIKERIIAALTPPIPAGKMMRAVSPWEGGAVTSVHDILVESQQRVHVDGLCFDMMRGFVVPAQAGTPC